jgi:hypothetical protein
MKKRKAKPIKPAPSIADEIEKAAAAGIDPKIEYAKIDILLGFDPPMDSRREDMWLDAPMSGASAATAEETTTPRL